VLYSGYCEHYKIGSLQEYILYYYQEWLCECTWTLTHLGRYSGFFTILCMVEVAVRICKVRRNYIRGGLQGITMRIAARIYGMSEDTC